MKIGIIADTHDNIYAIRQAVCFFNTQNLKYVIHAGDYIAPFSLKELMNVNSKFFGVFGNNDGERKGLLAVCKDIHEPPYDFILDGKHIMVTHMIESLSKRSIVNTDIIVSAHTHTHRKLSRVILCTSIQVNVEDGYMTKVQSQYLTLRHSMQKLLIFQRCLWVKVTDVQTIY